MRVSCVLCLECGTLVRSYSVHDYRTCSCPNSAMNDGGSSYQLHGAMDLQKISSGTLDDVTGIFEEGVFNPDQKTKTLTSARWPY